MTDAKELIKKYILEKGINVTESITDKFYTYLRMLQEYNKKINLTAITDDKEVIIKHFIDSLTCLEVNIFSKGCMVVDVGTGAGFPGVPIKIVRPDIKILLIETLNKRVIFLQELVKALNLEGVDIIKSRAEDSGQNKEYREKYDIAISRAVAKLSVLSEYCMPLVKPDGYFLSMKGPNIDEELNEARNAIKILGGEIKEIKTAVLPETEVKYNLVLINKIKKTPTKYPRKAGKPSKAPLS